jgi:hypothetical protein
MKVYNKANIVCEISKNPYKIFKYELKWLYDIGIDIKLIQQVHFRGIKEMKQIKKMQCRIKDNLKKTIDINKN